MECWGLLNRFMKSWKRSWGKEKLPLKNSFQSSGTQYSTVTFISTSKNLHFKAGGRSHPIFSLTWKKSELNSPLSVPLILFGTFSLCSSKRRGPTSCSQESKFVFNNKNSRYKIEQSPYALSWRSSFLRRENWKTTKDWFSLINWAF